MMEYYLAIKSKGLVYTTTWMNYRITVGRNKPEKTYHMIPFTQNSRHVKSRTVTKRESVVASQGIWT
jgi:hypothetical protein